MADQLTRIISNELNLRAYTVTTRNTVNEIVSFHNPSPNALFPLARTINAAALLGATLKPGSNQSLGIKFSGSGPLQEVYVQADARGNIRGYVANPNADENDTAGDINFSRAIGAGFLTVTRDLGLREPYTSIMPLHYGDVARDIAYYLTTSEQVPSALILGMHIDPEGNINASGGILIQTFPGTGEESIRLAESNIYGLMRPLGEDLAEGRDINDVLSEIFGGHPGHISSTSTLQDSCRCSRDLISSVLSSLSEYDLTEMIEMDNGAEVICTFCRSAYNFTEEELRFFLSIK